MTGHEAAQWLASFATVTDLDPSYDVEANLLDSLHQHVYRVLDWSRAFAVQAGLHTDWSSSSSIEALLCTDGVIIYSLRLELKLTDYSGLAKYIRGDRPTGGVPPIVGMREDLSSSVWGPQVRVRSRQTTLSTIECLLSLSYLSDSQADAYAGLLGRMKAREFSFGRPWDAARFQNVVFQSSDAAQSDWYRFVEIHLPLDPVEWHPLMSPAHAALRALTGSPQSGDDETLFLTPLGSQIGRTPYFLDRLERMRQTLSELQVLVAQNSNELKMQKCLRKAPELIEPTMMQCWDRPRWSYSNGKVSPSGKSRVEPDFVLRLPSDRYLIVEIERPGKRQRTKAGHATAEQTQATFQLTEFEHAIESNPDALDDEYPGIRYKSNRKTMLILGRGETGELDRAQSIADDVLTWSDLVERAEVALGLVESHPPSDPSSASDTEDL